jgi:hypothetical protein
MGQILRMNRAARFIDAFGKDLTAQLPLAKGDRLTVESIGIGPRDSDGEQVVVNLAVKKDGGEVHEVELTDWDVLFDPEYETAGDMVEWLSEMLGISEDECHERMKAADLV